MKNWNAEDWDRFEIALSQVSPAVVEKFGGILDKTSLGRIIAKTAIGIVETVREAQGFSDSDSEGRKRPEGA